jgi:hypothetical protein
LLHPLQVFAPADNEDGYGGLNDCCNNWIVTGFICEFYGAPGDMAFGLAKQWDAAEQSCQACLRATAAPPPVSPFFAAQCADDGRTRAD